MDTGWTQDLLNWLNANPAWGVAIVFLVAFFESLVLIGILLPGIVILFGVGALIGLGVLDIGPIWLAASCGAFLGDFLSYAVGRHFRSHLLDLWPFSRYPGMMDRGAQFFRTHGAKSVVAGRFIGPLRPVIPAVGGMLGMQPGRFLAVDIPACIAWAPAFLIPGMLFGASLEVASEYTGRLTVMLVVALAILWLSWWLIRLIYEPLASRSARWMRHVIRWTRRHPLLGRISGSLVDPARPEALSVFMLGLLLVLLFWGLVMLLFLSPFAAQPQAVDQIVQQWALALRNHLADPAMVAISQLSRWPVSVFSATALLLWLIGAGRRNAALHWLIAFGVGGALHLLLSWSLRATPQVLEMGGQALRGPSAAMSLSTVTLTFFAIMVAGQLRRKHRQWPYVVAALTLSLLAMARLYLGLEWLSGALMGMAMGLAWAALVGIAYRQRALHSFSGAMACLIFYGSGLLLWSWQAQEHTSADLKALEAPLATQQLAEQDWWQNRWAELPENRTEVMHHAARRFNAQIAVDPERIIEQLEDEGWQRVDLPDWRWLVQSMNPNPDAATLPLLSRLYRGRQEAVLLRKPGNQEESVQTLRMWDSGVRLMPGDRTLYLAQISDEVIHRRLGVFGYWSSRPVAESRLQPISDPQGVLQQKVMHNGLLLIRSAVR